MGRTTRRAGMQALQAIKEAGKPLRTKKSSMQVSENSNPAHGGVKRASSPSSSLPPNAKRNALGDVTNNALKREVVPKMQHVVMATRVVPVLPQPSLDLPRKPDRRRPELNMSIEDSQKSTATISSEDTPVTAMQNVLQATTLDDDSLRSDESLEEEEAVSSRLSPSSTYSSPQSQPWKDIDAAEIHDPLFSSEYAPDIYRYMCDREVFFTMKPYMHQQPDISSGMRTILVDWLIEVQENFELFHETLYLAVKLVDLYLSRKEVKREYLQLVGATSMLISAKFEELSPPLVDDFLYLCDDAYTHADMLKMEGDILKVVDYDINIPIAYRFLRRLARAAEATMETHTLARYIAESSLQEYQFVDVRPSLVAASAMYLALRMRKLGPWTATLQHYSGYDVQEMLSVVERLNSLIQIPLGQTNTVRCKYSHEVFFKVALNEPLASVEEDAKLALAECPPTLHL